MSSTPRRKRSLTSFKKLLLKFNFNNPRIKSVYWNMLSKVASTYNLRFSVDSGSNIVSDGLEVYLTDKIDENSLEDLLKNNRILIYNFTEHFEPNLGMFFVDMFYFRPPLQNTLVKSLTHAAAFKDEKNKILSDVVSYSSCLKSDAFEKAYKSIRNISKAKKIPEGLNIFLRGKLELATKNYEEAFNYFSLAHTMNPSNPLFLYEMQNLLYILGDKEGALDVCTKYIQKFPLSKVIIRRGIELSILTRKFDYLDLYFEATKKTKFKDTKFTSVYNAGLSVYVRYLIRKKMYRNSCFYSQLLVQSTLDQIYWKNLLEEMIVQLPGQYWNEVYSDDFGSIISSLFPKEGSMIQELVVSGLEVAVHSCVRLKKNGSNISPRMQILIDNILSTDPT